MTDLTQGRFELEDVHGQPLRFTGQRVGFATSQQPDNPKLRWMELTIFVTEAGAYVLERVAQTTVPDEVVKARAQTYASPTELIDALHTSERDRDTNELTGVQYLTYTARDALFEAMEHDEGLRRGWAELGREVA